MENMNFEQFKERWHEKCKEIQLKAFEPRHCFYIKSDFHKEVLSFLSTGISVLELNMLSSDIDLALYIAMSYYRIEQNQNIIFWSLSIF